MKYVPDFQCENPNFNDDNLYKISNYKEHSVII
jgi:hypothetical protein